MAGISSLKESAEKIISPDETHYSVISITIVAVAVFVKFFLGKYVKNTGKKIDSQSLIASGTDAYFDAVVSFSTFIAAIISLIWNFTIEGYLGILIAALIIKSGMGILKETLNTMIGIRADGKLTKRIKDRINSFENVEGTYDLILHSYGPSKIIGALNIQVDENMTAKEIHGLTKRIIHAIEQEFAIMLTIGIYASNQGDELSVEVQNYLEDILKNYHEILQLHGFYLDEEEKNISFDIIVDFGVKNSNQIKSEIIDKMKEKYSDYNYSVVIDNEFCDL